jgi:hypothetical protein
MTSLYYDKENYSNTLRIIVFSFLLDYSSSSHLVYTQTGISLSTTAPLLAGIDTISLSSAVPLTLNTKYAVLLSYGSIANTRQYMGALNVATSDSALVRVSNNLSLVSPCGYFPGYNGYSIGIRLNGNSLLDILLPTLATVGATLPNWITNATEIGQTFNSGSLSSLTSVGFFLAAGTSSANAINNVTLRIYNLEAFPNVVNVSFPFYQETSSPTSLPTSIPSSLPSSTPSSFPSSTPSSFPSSFPSNFPTSFPSSFPTSLPTVVGATLMPTPNPIPTSTPTSIPTSTPTSTPSGIPSTIPTSTPSGITSITPTLIPNIYFTPPNCGTLLMPIQFSTANIVCNQTTPPTLGNSNIVGAIVSITAYYTNGSKLIVKNLPTNNEIIFFIPFLNNISQNNVSCIWFTDSNQISEDGCRFISSQVINGSSGVTCSCNHLTSFSLIIYWYENGPSVIHRSISQYIYIIIASFIALIATIQIYRMFAHKLELKVIGYIHFAILFANIIMAVTYIIFPILEYYPKVLVFLLSVVNSLELICYIVLVYVWTFPFAMKKTKMIWKFKCSLEIGLFVMVLINSGIPLIMMVNLGEKVDIQLATAGSYLMGLFMLGICLSLIYRGMKLYVELSYAKQFSNSGKVRIFSLRTRIIFGTVVLGICIVMQAFSWVISVVPYAFNNFDSDSDGVGFNFIIPIFVTYATLLFLFSHGVDDVVTKSRTSSQTSRKSVTHHSGSGSEEQKARMTGSGRLSRSPSGMPERGSLNTGMCKSRSFANSQDFADLTHRPHTSSGEDYKFPPIEETKLLKKKLSPSLVDAPPPYDISTITDLNLHHTSIELSPISSSSSSSNVSINYSSSASINSCAADSSANFHVGTGTDSCTRISTTFTSVVSKSIENKEEVEG